MNKLQNLIKEKCPDGVDYVEIKSIAEVGTGSSDRKDAVEYGEYPFYVRSKEIFKINRYEYDETAIVIPGEGGIGEIFHFVQGKYALHQRAYRIHLLDDRIDAKYLYYYMFANFKSFIIKKAVSATVTSIRKPMIEEFEIPVPPIEVQQEIVRILDKFTELEAELQAELNARKKQYEYYRNQLFTFGEEIPFVTFSEISVNCDKKRKPITGSQREKGYIPYYGASGVVDYVKDYIFDGDYLLISEDGANLTARVTPIAFSISGKTWVNNHAHVIYFDTDIDRKFIEYYLNSIDLSYYITGAAQPKLNQENLNKIPLPNPSYEVKKRFVEILDEFSTICESEQNGLLAEIEARHKQYEYYRDKLFTFERKVV